MVRRLMLMVQSYALTVRLPGFDLSEMAKDVYEDAIVDVASAESMVSDPIVLKVSLFTYFVFDDILKPGRLIGYFHSHRNDA
jgi:hypothetical protein